MTVGVHRSEVEYAWPRSLTLPVVRPRLVYLDLNHWIGLAKAATGHRDAGVYVDVLRASRDACNRGFLFVLSGQHYMEMSLIRAPAQRAQIAEVMEELTGFASLRMAP